MIDKLIRTYSTYMLQDVRSPIPHLAGPPGVGKSQSVMQLAELITEQRLAEDPNAEPCKVHIVNVSRISPLEIEGVQMPVGSVETDDYRLKLLHSTLWTQLKEGDIVLLDEFMRGVPEVYNGLLDIMTSREVAGFQLPKVFFVAASNSVAAYDEALRDRLLHIFVPDIRSSITAKTRVKDLLIEEIGLYPEIRTSSEIEALVNDEILPMYNVLDTYKGKSLSAINSTSKGKGHSVRNLVGQVKLREVQVKALKELIEFNNRKAITDGKHQYVVLLNGRNPDPQYVRAAEKLKGNDKLTPLQAINLEINLGLIESEGIITNTKKEETTDEAE